MGAPTEYLYGDSTPSPLKTDFIGFLRETIDFGVKVLSSDSRLAEAVLRAAQLSAETEKEIEAVEAFAVEVSRTMDRAAVGDPQSLSARCAARIRQGALDLVRAEVDAARNAADVETQRAAQGSAAEREACFKAFAALVLRHELPDEVKVLQLRLAEGHYAAELHGHSPYGLEWVVALEIPPSSPLSQVLRIDRVVERLEVDAPEEAGWIRKETKIRALRFDRFYMVALTLDPAQATIKLRTVADGTGGGFDVCLRPDPQRAQLVRIAEAGDAPEPPYDVLGEDVGKLFSLCDALTAMGSALFAHKKSVVRASLDGTSLDQLEGPRAVVDRLVAHIAPTVQEMGRRSLTPGELVLKRYVSESHREELFVSRAELEQKVQALSASARTAFDPLKLFDHAPGLQATVAPRVHVEPATHGALKTGAEPKVDDEVETVVVTRTPPEGLNFAKAPAERAAAPESAVASSATTAPKPVVQGSVGATPPRPSSGPPRA